MLHARGISRAFGGQTVLDEVSISLDGRDRVGVVGPNGVGKTTLLRVLAGLEAPDAGSIERAPRQLTVGYLPQEPDAVGGETLLAYLARRTGVAAASAELDRCTAELSEDPATHRRVRRCARSVHGSGRRRPRGPGGGDHRVGGSRAGRRGSRSERRRRPVRPAGGQPVRGRGGPGRAGRHLVVPGRRAAARRAHQQPRLRRPGSARSGSSTASPARCWWCPTTATSSIAACTASWSSTATATGPAPSPAAGPPTPRPGTWPGPSSRGPRAGTRPSASDWSSASAPRSSGPSGGSGGRRPPASRTRPSGRRTGSAARSRPARSRPPSGAWPSCRRWTSPGRAGACELSLAATARSGDVVVRLDQAVVERRVGATGVGRAAGSGSVPSTWRSPGRTGVAILGPERLGQVHPVGRAAGSVPLVSGRPLDRAGGPHRRDGPGPRALRRPRDGAGHVPGPHRSAAQRVPLAAGQVRAGAGPPRPGRPRPVAR